MEELPNILWIVSDATRHDHLSCYGYSRPTTPNLEVLAEQATVYENAIAQAPWSLPSYTTLLTGLYPGQHGANSSYAKLDATVRTLPQYLVESYGYNTACFTANPYVTPDFGLDKGFREHKLVDRTTFLLRLKGQFSPLRRVQDRMRAWQQYLGLVDQGASALVKMTKDFVHRADEPWFIFLVVMDAHHRYAPPLEWALESQRGFRDIVTYPLFCRRLSNVFRFLAKNPSDRDWHRLIRLYDAEIRYVDHCIGKVIRTLKDRAMYDNTLLILSADHGEALGERGRIGHVGIAETLVHSPLIVKRPGQLRPQRKRAVVELRHVPVALMGGQITNFDLPDAECALAQYLGSPIRTPDQWQQSFFDEHQLERKAQLVRTVEWEYIEYEDGVRELFHIEEDPAETTNLVNDRPEVAAEMQKKLHAKLREIETTGPDIEREYADISPEVEQRLRDLGYL